MGNTPGSLSSSLVLPGTPGKDDSHKEKEASSAKKDKKDKDKTPSSSSKTPNTKKNAAQTAAESATERAKKVFGDVQNSIQSSVKKLEEQDHPAAHLIDTVCGPYFDPHGSSGKTGKSNAMRDARSASFYSEDYNSDDSRTLSFDEQTLDTDYNGASTVNGSTVASSVAPSGSDRDRKSSRKGEDNSYLSQSDYESEPHHHSKSRNRRKKRDKHNRRYSDDEEEDDDEDDDDTQTQLTAEPTATTTTTTGPTSILAKPLASSFAKRCYFTKAGIGKTTQHYEGLTLTGNVVLMLASAMKLKGCPTICDEDLRRVEQTYPNQFSRLPDELLLSSGWRRISKYCHFSNKPIPDGIPFFHSKQRLHPQGGYYFLLAAAVGMVRPIDVEPLTRDTLVLLETDYPSQCDAAPPMLIQDPDEWTLVNKFCFFSGGPINTEEDVYYQADFDGNPIYMLAFLSPALTPEELYKLEIVSEHNNGVGDQDMQLALEAGLTSVVAVQEVESVYDLTERDFHDLKLYHLGPCRALPQYILQPLAWTKVLPPHFLEARHRAILRAQEYEMQHGGPVAPMNKDPMAAPAQQLTVGATPIDGRTPGMDPHSQPYYGPPNGQQQQHHHQGHPQNPSLPYHQQQQHYQQHPPQHHGGMPPHTHYDDPQQHMMAQHHHQQQQIPPHMHHQHPDAQLQQGGENGYYMQEPGGPGFNSEYESVGHRNIPHNMASMSPAGEGSHMPSYQQHPGEEPISFQDQASPHHYQLEQHELEQQQQQHHLKHQQDQYQSPHPVYDGESQLQYSTEADDRSRQSSSFQREVEEEGAFVSTSEAPMDEAIGTRHSGSQGMDPPEQGSPEPAVNVSVNASESMPQNPNNATSGYFEEPTDTLEVSQTESQYSANDDNLADSPPEHTGDAPSYGGSLDEDAVEGDYDDQVPVYSYSESPQKGDDYYHHNQEQSRDDQYYDSPEPLKDQPGSQDHEFFNAHSGGGEDEDDYPASSFEQQGQMGRHPDDFHDGGYYEDTDVDAPPSGEYMTGGQGESPSPIKMDHLRRLGTPQQQSPARPASMAASPMSQGSANSVSEYSHSSAMRGAQELLKRNRQRRHEQARRRLNKNDEVRVNESLDTDGSPLKSSTQYAFGPDEEYDETDHPMSPRTIGDDASTSTWGESANSEALHSVVSGSSVWTDSSSNPADRSSRRALILQMAKARMKSNKDRDPAEHTIKEEKSGSMDDASYEASQISAEMTATDLDFAADLD